MSDFLNIRVTERELDLIMDLLHEAGLRTDADGQPAIEICHDLMEQSGRVIDEIEPTEIVICDAEARMFNAGVDAREQVKASSRAAERRALNFSARDDSNRTDQQRHDVWERPNDPTKW